MTAAEIQMRKNGNNIFMGINNTTAAKAGTEAASRVEVEVEAEAVAYLEPKREWQFFCAAAVFHAIFMRVFTARPTRR